MLSDDVDGVVLPDTDVSFGIYCRHWGLFVETTYVELAGPSRGNVHGVRDAGAGP